MIFLKKYSLKNCFLHFFNRLKRQQLINFKKGFSCAYSVSDLLNNLQILVTFFSNVFTLEIL